MVEKRWTTCLVFPRHESPHLPFTAFLVPWREYVGHPRELVRVHRRDRLVVESGEGKMAYEHI